MMQKRLAPGNWQLALAAAMLLTWSTDAIHADNISYSSTITGANPTYNRTNVGSPPSGLSFSGTNVSYHLQPFYVNITDTYTLQTTAAAFSPNTADDSFIVLYQTAFNPATPLVNALESDDDQGVGFLSLISNRPLTANTQYFLVVSSFANSNFGSFTAQISNPTTGHTAILGIVAVPEPSTWALIGAGSLLTSVGYGYRRWQARAKQFGRRA